MFKKKAILFFLEIIFFFIFKIPEKLEVATKFDFMTDVIDLIFDVQHPGNSPLKFVIFFLNTLHQAQKRNEKFSTINDSVTETYSPFGFKYPASLVMLKLS